MAEYLSREEALNLIEHNDRVCHYADEQYENVVYATAQTICKVVAEMPAADVQPTERVIEVEQLLEECERKLRYLLECEIESSSERQSVTKLLDKIQARYTKDGDTK